MRARGAVAYAVALLVFLCVGLWLGAHPTKLPAFVRDAFADTPSSLTAEAAEVLQDNYYRPVGSTELSNSSLQGMVRGLRRRHGDRFTEYFSPESLESFNQAIEGRFSGVGLSVVRHVIAAHHGSIGVDSRAGEGTTITVRLPAGP